MPLISECTESILVEDDLHRPLVSNDLYNQFLSFLQARGWRVPQNLPVFGIKTEQRDLLEEWEEFKLRGGEL